VAYKKVLDCTDVAEVKCMGKYPLKIRFKCGNKSVKHKPLLEATGEWNKKGRSCWREEESL
jgi:hypothetical protein